MYTYTYLWKIEAIVHSCTHLRSFLVRSIHLVLTYSKCCEIWFLKHWSFGIPEIISVRETCSSSSNSRFTWKCRIKPTSKIRKATASTAWTHSKGELSKYREEMSLFKFLSASNVSNICKLSRPMHKISSMSGCIAKKKGMWNIIRKH